MGLPVPGPILSTTVIIPAIFGPRQTSRIQLPGLDAFRTFHVVFPRDSGTIQQLFGG